MGVEVVEVVGNWPGHLDFTGASRVEYSCSQSKLERHAEPLHPHHVLLHAIYLGSSTGTGMKESQQVLGGGIALISPLLSWDK